MISAYFKQKETSNCFLSLKRERIFSIAFDNRLKRKKDVNEMFYFNLLFLIGKRFINLIIKKDKNSIIMIN